MNTVLTKTCTTCKKDKKLSEFHKCKGGAYGVKSVCKECRKEEKKEYSSRDYVIEKQKTYYQDHKETIRNRLNKHYWTLNGQYHEYKKHAKKRKIEFNLTQNDCTAFYNTNCHYCGDSLNGIGIDRVDSSKGYSLGNVVPCCSKCNFMKHVLTTDEFLTHIKKIIEHMKK